MVPKFNYKSLTRLSTCHPDLQRLMERVVETFDISIIEGERDQATQDKYFSEGKSQLKYPQSKHNKTPSLAIDIVPYPTAYSDEKLMVFLAGFVMATAEEMNISIRWGGDWDKDWGLADNRFNDYPHFELVD